MMVGEWRMLVGVLLDRRKKGGFTAGLPDFQQHEQEVERENPVTDRDQEPDEALAGEIGAGELDDLREGGVGLRERGSLGDAGEGEETDQERAAIRRAPEVE